MTDPSRSFSTHKLLPLAGTVEAITVGLGFVLQVVSGAQQGIRIDFRDPRTADFTERWGIAADLNGVRTLCVADSAWITFPASVDETVPLILRAYTAGEAPAAPQEQPLAGVREERVIFYDDGFDVAAGQDDFVFAFRNTNTFISPEIELPHRRRFTRLQFFLEATDTQNPASNYVVTLRMRGAPTGTSIDGRRWTQRIDGRAFNNTRTSLFAECPLPLTAWRLRILNPGLGVITFGMYVMETT